MMRYILNNITIGCLLVVYFIFIACTKEEDPASLPPLLSVNEAQEITRTSAVLTGTVKAIGKGEITSLNFRYGTSAADMQMVIECDSSLTQPSATLVGLEPNTTYYYCLEAGNGYSIAQSPSLSFTTFPNQEPVIGNLQILGQGPLSITLQYEITDNGGEPLTETGFYCTEENGEERTYAMSSSQGTVFQYRIGGLKMKTSYTVQAYAINSIGETRSELLQFQTGQVVTTTTAGTLAETIGEEGKYLHTELTIAGPLNGTDIRFLRDMLGRDVEGNETAGQLRSLNLTDVTIHARGISYDGMYYTKDNCITYGMFSNCPYLQELILPDLATVVEENAFANCPTLTTIHIPAGATEVSPSDNCPLLSSVEVSSANAIFCSVDGVLYNKDCTALYWFPEGKTSGTTVFPDALEEIGNYAFRNYRGGQINLPSTLRKIGTGAFHASYIESMTVPDNVTNLPAGVFQGCSKLRSVILGKGMSNLSSYCFDSCPLEHLYVEVELFPPMCQDDTFGSTNDLFKTCILHVPKGYLNQYRNHDVWGRFEQIVGETSFGE